MHVNPLLGVRTTRRDAATFLVLLITACSLKKTPLTADRKMCPHLGRDVPVLASHFGFRGHAAFPCRIPWLTAAVPAKATPCPAELKERRG